ncbi:MAG: allantoinase [Gaiellales bacterium]|nr:allantoinase [Gaiellales bacterium]
MTYDLVIRGGTLVTPAGVATGDLGVGEGMIREIADELAGGHDEIDARGFLVVPGAVDAHVHLNDPGRADWEGIASGTAALAAGGSTTAIDMPLNAHPPTVDAAAFDLKAARIAESAHVDIALWGGLVPGNVGRLSELAERGVVGFKAFMCSSGIDDFAAADDTTLLDGMREAARLGLPVAVHAESDTLTSTLAARAVSEGRTTMRDFLASRPVEAELEAIERALALAEETGCSLHVVHVSSGRGVALVAEARARGLDVTCETSPHYLVLTDEDAERLGAVAKCAPPLRPAAEREALWAAVATGELPLIASDHSPSPPELKQSENAFEAWGGIAGAQTLLALTLDEGERRRIPLETLVAAVASFPARRFALPGKGALEVGADADMALVRQDTPWTLTAEHLRSRHRLSPFIGRQLRHRVVRTLLRGRTVQADGQIVAEPGGRLVRTRPH